MPDAQGLGSEWEQLAFAELLAPHVIVDPVVRRSAPPMGTYEECLAEARLAYTGRSRDALLIAQLRLREMHRARGPLHTIVAPLEVIHEILEGMDR